MTAHGGPPSRPRSCPGAGPARDPVCGMTVDPRDRKAPQRAQRARPITSARPAAPRSSPPTPPNTSTRTSPPRRRLPVPEGTIYTCPMHPQIRQAGPAPARSAAWRSSRRSSTADTGPNPELADMTRRFWVGLALCLPVFVLEMGAHIVGAHGWIDPILSNWIQLAFATPVVLWAGWPFFVRGWQSLVDAQSQHVHADRDGHRRRVPLQRRRDARARPLPGGVPRPWRRGRGLFRGRRRHHRAGAARPGARTARARADLGRDPRAARSRAEDRAPHPRRHRGGHRARPGARSAIVCACAPAKRCRSTAS